MSEALPLLSLHGLSSSDFAPALEQFLGTGHGLSPATITRLTEQWKHHAAKFGQRSLKDVDYVSLWVDGIHLTVRLETDKVCLLVMTGVRADGRKELVAAGGTRSATCWRRCPTPPTRARTWRWRRSTMPRPEVLLAFCDSPAERRIQLPTTNPIESP